MPSEARVIGWLFVACGRGDTDSGQAPVPTWSADVAPVVAEHCGRCHDGTDVGTFPLTTYDEVVGVAALLDAVMANGSMPPPAADPDCAPYEGADHFVLDDAERGTIQAWLEGGTPQGAAGATATAIAAPHLSRVDAELFTAAPYVPQFDGINEYRCFQLDNPAELPVYITGMEPLIDVTRISHHTALFVDDNGSSDALVTDPATRSWTCPEVVPDAEWPMLHAWAPGSNPVEFPAGMGMKVEPSWTLILQMHYFRPDPSVDGIADHPGYRFMVETEVDQEIFFFPYGPERFTIPAGEKNYQTEVEYRVSDLLYGLPFELTIYGLLPHMHVLGKSYEAWGRDSDGKRICVSEADDYDFSNQPTYMLTEPITIPNDGELGFSCRFDNSEGNPDQINDPVADVTWGENTEQEMCYGLFYVTWQ